MSLQPAIIRRVMREIAELQRAPPEGIRVSVNEDDMLDLTGIIEGPEGTPYAGGYFRVKFKFTEEFPAAPPKCWFATKIFHPNVSSAGEICVNTLKKDWQSSFGIGHILVTVKCLLIYPNPESALDEEAGKALLEDYDGYCKRAKMMTSVHATPRTKPVEFHTPSAPSISTVVTTLSQTLPQSGDTASQTPRKLSTSQPLQESSPSNQGTMTIPASTISSTSLSSKEKENPLPLGLADSNINIAAGNGAAVSAKAVKRSAVANGEAKRKKALKRL